nr:ribonuclease H-like domain-containing protein [Tanacetum cinerariifolium]
MPLPEEKVVITLEDPISHSFQQVVSELDTTAGDKSGRTLTLTAEDMQRKKNNVKARTTLLLSLPDEHQLRFSKYKTARELWAAILKTFGGNEATKKTKKNLLKQQYGNFKAKGSETLEQTFNRLQVIVGQLQFMDIEIEQDDLNQKLLTSLAPKWLMHTIVLRNRSDLDTMSLDDLYNHLKVYESEVQKKPEKNSQKMAFISSEKHISKNKDGNTASVPTASTNVPTASASVATISQGTACAYIASQSSGSQIKFEDINQIYEDDMEEMDIKWKMALLSMRADKFWKKTGKKISIQGSDVAGFDKSKVECFNCHKMGHFARECRAPKSQDRGRRDNFRHRPSPTTESISNRNTSVSKTVASPITSKPFIKFVRPKDSQSDSKTDKKETPKKPPVKHAEQPFVHTPYRLSQRPVKTHMNDARPNRTFFNKQAHPYTNRPVHITSAVKSPSRAPWVPTVNRNYSPVNRKFSTGSRNFPTANRKFPTASRKFPSSSTRGITANMGMKGKAVKPLARWFWRPSQNLSNKGPKNNTISGSSQNKINDKGYWDSVCSRHMTGNISYLSDFEPYDGGYVSFGQGGCKITGKGTIKTGKLKFKNVYFVKDLKYNLFSVLQIYDNKNSVLFTDPECIVLGRDFKLLDDANILLRTPRQHNMYSIDLNNIVPHRDLTCLVAKASVDE